MANTDKTLAQKCVPDVADRTDKERASDVLVRRLAQLGVTRVFGIPGGPISPVTDALFGSGIEHVTCQHESMAVYAATGYARATGVPSVVLVTSGPGVLNALTALAAAYHDEAPVVLLVGEVATVSAGKGVLQDGGESGLRIHQMVAPISKYADTLDIPARIESMIDAAFECAMEHPRGPVVLQLPVDICAATAGGASFRLRTPPQILGGNLPPNESLCAEIADALVSARRPLILVGGPGGRSGAAAELRALAEATACPVATDLEGKGVFPESHPLSMGIWGVGSRGRVAEYLAGGIDFLLTVGARLDDTTTLNFNPLLIPSGTFAQIDYDPRRLGRAFAPSIMLAADIPLTLSRIHEHVYVDRLTLARRESAVQPLNRVVPAPEVTSPGAFDPRIIIRNLQSAFRHDTVYVSDIGNHLLFAGSGLELELPDQFHVSMGLGGMGSGIGMGIGLAAAYQGTRNVVVVCGDGGMLMCGTELATAVRYGFPVTVVVMNDACLGMVQHGSERVYGRSADWRTPPVDFVAFARSLGLAATRLTDTAQFAEFAHGNRLRPQLIEVPIDLAVRPVNPRDETLNFPSEVA